MDQWCHDFFARKAAEPDPTKVGVIETVIGNWRYWATYYRNIEYGIHGRHQYDIEVVWFQRDGNERTDNPEDCGATLVPETWLADVAGMLLVILNERIVEKVGDWSLKEKQ